MTEYYNIDFTLNLNNAEADANIIYNTIKNHVDNYIMTYKKKTHIYVGYDCIDYLLWDINFTLKSMKSSYPYIGILCDCYIYTSEELEKNNLYLSNNIINIKKEKRKLKLNQLGKSNEDNKI